MALGLRLVGLFGSRNVNSDVLCDDLLVGTRTLTGGCPQQSQSEKERNGHPANNDNRHSMPL